MKPPLAGTGNPPADRIRTSNQGAPMDTIDGPTTSREPIYQQLVNEADDTARLAVTPAQPPEPDVGRSDNGGSC
jgi:hypothetical protein